VEDALTRFPDCKGYLFLQDDCVLHFWNYLSYDLNKIWFAVKFNDGNQHSNKFFDIRNVNGRSIGLGRGWRHWTGPWGFKVAWSALANFTHQERQHLEANVGQGNIPCIMCEVFYIPNHLRESALRLNQILKNVFCEIEIPTMLCSLDYIHNWEQLNMFGGEGIGNDGIHSPKLTNYPVNVSWVHPVKFSTQENREGIANIFKKMIS
jgi:hypothetical protein